MFQYQSFLKALYEVRQDPYTFCFARRESLMTFARITHFVLFLAPAAHLFLFVG